MYDESNANAKTESKPKPTKLEKKKSRFSFPLVLIETGLIVLFLLLKDWYLDTHVLKAQMFLIPFIAFTLLITLMLSLIFRLILPRHNHMPFLITFYSIVSVIMLIDTVYAAYIGRLPSVVSLKYAGQLGDVTGAVKQLITPVRLLLVADLPLWLLYGIFLRPRLHKRFATKVENFQNRNLLLTAIVTGSVVLCAAVIMISTAVVPSFKLRYLTSEILSYHVSDVYSFFHTEKKDLSSQVSEILGTGNQAVDENEPLYGIAKGKNVIVVQVEALQGFAVGYDENGEPVRYNGQELTPNLNAFLAENSLYFDHHYYQVGGGNTADAEFTVLNSLYAPEGESAYEKYTDNTYYGLPWILKDNGYSGAYAFHGCTADFWNREEAYPYQGFDDYVSMEDFPEETERIDMGISDKEIFAEATRYLSEKAEDGPFFSMIVTLSSHFPYFETARQGSLELYPEDYDTLQGNYLNAINYFDDAFGTFLQDLKDAGLYDNTMIVLYGDHMALPVDNDVNDAFLNRYFYTQSGYSYMEQFKVPLIIHIPGMESQIISTPNGHIDVLPTLLHLLGIHNDMGIMLGTDTLSVKNPIVLEEQHLPRGSYFTEDVFYQYSGTGIDMLAQAFDLKTGEQMDAAPYVAQGEEAKKLFDRCMYILDNNLVCSLGNSVIRG